MFEIAVIDVQDADSPDLGIGHTKESAISRAIERWNDLRAAYNQEYRFSTAAARDQVAAELHLRDALAQAPDRCTPAPDALLPWPALPSAAQTR